jgi:hypothetical protein
MKEWKKILTISRMNAISRMAEYAEEVALLVEGLRSRARLEG